MTVRFRFGGKSGESSMTSPEQFKSTPQYIPSRTPSLSESPSEPSSESPSKASSESPSESSSQPLLESQSPKQPPPSLSTLPPELHLLITSHLPYPDALSLKHTSRHFYSLVDTSISLKISWLIARRQLHLECPHSGQCVLKTDREFCRGSVRLLMERRRWHEECGGGRGCLVLGTGVCVGKKRRGVWARWRRGNGGLESWWGVVVGVLGVLVSVLCLGLGRGLGLEVFGRVR